MKPIANFLLLALTISITACKTTKSDVYISELEIFNTTDIGVTITSYLENMPVKNIYIQKGKSFYTKEVGESPISAAQFWNSDSFQMEFDDGNKLIYSWYRLSPTSKNILVDGWTINKIADRQSQKTYSIQQEHRDSAR